MVPMVVDQALVVRQIVAGNPWAADAARHVSRGGLNRVSLGDSNGECGCPKGHSHDIVEVLEWVVGSG